LIQRALAGDRLPHAYIFHGPDGVGKEMLALRLASILLCEAPVSGKCPDIPELSGWGEPIRDACGQCRSCHLVEVGNHPDCHLIYRQLNVHHPDSAVRSRKALDLGVDVVRHFVIDAVGVKPTCGRAKVFVVREADRITPAAQNALLKTLEEPPPTTFLLLLASGLENLLSTTRSRCQLVGFSPLPREFVGAKVTECAEDVSEEAARLYAALAQGSLGAALTYAEDHVTTWNDQIIDMLAGLNTDTAQTSAGNLAEAAKELSGRYRQRNRELSDTDAQRQALRVIFLLMATYYGDLQHLLTGTTELVANVAVTDRLQAVAKSRDVAAVGEDLSAIAEAERQIGLSANVQLCLDTLMFKLARAGRGNLRTLV
jgi:DNA polymerase-3 subunit delta'